MDHEWGLILRDRAIDRVVGLELWRASERLPTERSRWWASASPPTARVSVAPDSTTRWSGSAFRQAAGLVVTELSRLTRSAPDLGAIIERLDGCDARLIAGAHALDTEDPNGRRFADLLVEISH